jgi:hypothetical protein
MSRFGANGAGVKVKRGVFIYLGMWAFAFLAFLLPAGEHQRAVTDPVPLTSILLTIGILSAVLTVMPALWLWMTLTFARRYRHRAGWGAIISGYTSSRALHWTCRTIRHRTTCGLLRYLVRALSACCLL